MNKYWQYEIDLSGLVNSQETDKSLRVFKSANIYEIHPHQQRITELAHKIAQHKLKRWKQISNPEPSHEMIRTLMQDKTEECMAVLLLDCKHRVISFDEIFPWSISSATVHTRVLVKKALEHNAGAIILTHNHPSWNPEPSQADINITNRIGQAMDLIEVKLLDHFIVSTEGSTSMAELGLI